MTSTEYMLGRNKYGRPQAIMFSENPGTLFTDDNGIQFYLPNGFEINSDKTLVSGQYDNFLILSDHNRQALDIASQRIEKRERTINGKMRSYYIADKHVFSTSWTDLPSRAFSKNPMFNQETGKQSSDGIQYTVDGGAGGGDLMDWYDNHKGSFYMFLSYDKKSMFGNGDLSYQNLNKYQEVIEVYFTDFSFSVSKRGRGTYDLWNINLTLEEA